MPKKKTASKKSTAKKPKKRTIKVEAEIPEGICGGNSNCSCSCDESAGNSQSSWKSCCKPKTGCCSSSNSTSCMYFLGLIGALVYYISHSTGFWGFLYAVFKALVWPAFVVYDALKFFGMQ